MSPSTRREPFRLSEDGEGRVYIASPWQPSAIIALLGAIALLVALRGAAASRHYSALALGAAIVEAGLLAGVVRARRRRVVFDAARTEVAFREGAATRRAIPFAEVRGIRIVPLGRGFQWSVQLVTTGDETIELTTTGVIETAKTLAAGLSSRFGFAPIAD